MLKATLTRRETSDEGTFGDIIFPKGFLFTGELPWRDNYADVSCLPEDDYVCEWTYSPRFSRYMYLLRDTSPRAGIRIHSANFMGDANKCLLCQLNGCIALGEGRGKMEGQKALLLSAPAVRRFESAFDYKPFVLSIRKGY